LTFSAPPPPPPAPMAATAAGLRPEAAHKVYSVANLRRARGAARPLLTEWSSSVEIPYSLAEVRRALIDTTTTRYPDRRAVAAGTESTERRCVDGQATDLQRRRPAEVARRPVQAGPA